MQQLLTGKPELLASVGFTQAWEGSTASSTMAQQKQAAGTRGFRPFTESALLCQRPKKLPKYSGKQLCVKEQRPLKYQTVFQLAPNCRDETEFHVTAEL